ncbi:MAG: D-alanyl-D-alanine carboxypeptidase/D-alanyl-D-alanine-endopeptidase [Bacteroidia bacterium]|nr:D-alanyl-D-alanine carboxypeptidase/D-alanyl-D-alanine-endopeptidase [Bacteroidia bacterium]
MKRIVFILFFYFGYQSTCSSLVWGQADFSAIDSLIARWLPESSEVGISVYDLTADKPLYGYHAKKLSRPASLMKLLTGITALAREESTLPFETTLWSNGTIVNDTLQGDLYVVGGFDPEFDDTAMRSLVNQLLRLKCQVIAGSIYADVSVKDSLYWGNGWAWDDTPAAYQPYLSPLMFSKGAVKVVATPAPTRGKAARITCTPRSSYYQVVNRTRTRCVGDGPFKVTRRWMENQNDLLIAGNVERCTIGWVNIHSSADFFMRTFLDRLAAKGISAPDTYRYRPFVAEPQASCLATWQTAMQQVLNQLMKESDNLNGEALLWRIGSQATGKKHIADKHGLAEIEKMIHTIGHRPENYAIADGCGLSNYNYLSPELVVDFLKFAHSRSDIFERLYPTLPIAGIDGTLKNRMKGGAAFKKVHAKTGSFTAINNLAGYARLKNGHLVAFAIMNQNILSAKQARRFQDKVCEWLCE